MPRLVREHGDRAGGLAERALVALGQPVQPEADLGRQEGVRAADLGEPVGVLDDPDRLALGVAVDAGNVAGDPGRLAGEPRLGARLLGLVEAVPAAVRQDEQGDRQDGERGHDDRPEPEAGPR